MNKVIAQAIENREIQIKRIEDEHYETIENILLNELIIPFCNKFNLQFISGNGTWFFTGVFGKRKTVFNVNRMEQNIIDKYDHIRIYFDYAEIKEAIELLEEHGIYTFVEYNSLFAEKNTPPKQA